MKKHSLSSVPKGQPRDVTIGQLIQPETFRSGLYLELQKFGRRPEELTAILPFDAKAVEAEMEGGKVDTFGLDLTVSEAKALQAVQILLDRTGYRGHQSEEVQSDSFRGLVKLATLRLTYTDFFQAYGLKRVQGRYQGATRKEAIKALRDLQAPRWVGFSRKRWVAEGGKKRMVTDIIRTRAPLVQIIESFEGLGEEEAERVKAGEEMGHRGTKLTIQVSPLLMEGIDSFFIMKPTSLFGELESISGGRRQARHISLFIEWLLTKNREHIKISMDSLGVRMRLEGYIKQRKPTLLAKKLRDCCETALKLGFLTNFSVAGSMLDLSLNPARCPRIRRGGEGTEA